MTKPDTYRSLSAISPIANPTRSDWGRKQLAAYLGFWQPVATINAKTLPDVGLG